MNRLGILLDLSHCGHRTTLEAIDASSRPVALTHANCFAVWPSPRNKTDETIKAVAARGGVIGATIWVPMVGNPHGGRPTVGDFLRHVAHIADLVGPEHLALGTDHSEGRDRALWEAKHSRAGKYNAVTGGLGDWFGFDTRYVTGFESCVTMPAIGEAIASLGFSEPELRGILGGNFLRLFRQVWGG